MSSATLHTVTGPVRAEEIGIVDAHSHLWIDAMAGADPAAPRLDDEELLLAGLEEYSRAGGAAVVDFQPPGCGLDANRLFQLSSTSGVLVIVCTGFHRQQGLLETRDRPLPIRPGFIKIAAEYTLAGSPLVLFEAVAAACTSTGLAIEMHTERGADVERFLTFFGDQGVSPDRLVFCHVDKRPDFELHRELAQAGVMLEYDTFFRPKYEPERNVWPLLLQMVAAGLAASVALATDMAEGEMWRDPGPAAFITAIGRRLDQEGIDPGQKRNLLGGNIIGRLATQAESLPSNPVNPENPVETH
jgi:phosphotriesterase-related protein